MYIGRKKTNFSRQSRAKKNKEKAKTKVLGLDSLNLLHTHTLMSTAKSGTKDEGFMKSSSVFIGVTTSVSCSFLQLRFLLSDSASIYAWEIKKCPYLDHLFLIFLWNFFKGKDSNSICSWFFVKTLVFFSLSDSPPENTMKWNDISMTSVSSSYFKPTTQSRSISSLESEPPALQHLLGV